MLSGLKGRQAALRQLELARGRLPGVNVLAVAMAKFGGLPPGPFAAKCSEAGGGGKPAPGAPVCVSEFRGLDVFGDCQRSKILGAEHRVRGAGLQGSQENTGAEHQVRGDRP